MYGVLSAWPSIRRSGYNMSMKSIRLLAVVSVPEGKLVFQSFLGELSLESSCGGNGIDLEGADYAWFHASPGFNGQEVAP